MPRGLSGTVVKTSDGVVGKSGSPVRIYSATWISGAAAGHLQLRNGTAASDTLWVSQIGTVNQSKTQNWEGGILFTDGCFYDHDSNITTAVFEAFTEI